MAGGTQHCRRRRLSFVLRCAIVCQRAAQAPVGGLPRIICSRVERGLAADIFVHNQRPAHQRVHPTWCREHTTDVTIPLRCTTAVPPTTTVVLFGIVKVPHIPGMRTRRYGRTNRMYTHPDVDHYVGEAGAGPASVGDRAMVDTRVTSDPVAPRAGASAEPLDGDADAAAPIPDARDASGRTHTASTTIAEQQPGAEVAPVPVARETGRSTAAAAQTAIADIAVELPRHGGGPVRSRRKNPAPVRVPPGSRPMEVAVYPPWLGPTSSARGAAHGTEVATSSPPHIEPLHSDTSSQEHGSTPSPHEGSGSVGDEPDLFARADDALSLLCITPDPMWPGAIPVYVTSPGVPSTAVDAPALRANVTPPASATGAVHVQSACRPDSGAAVPRPGSLPAAGSRVPSPTRTMCAGMGAAPPPRPPPSTLRPPLALPSPPAPAPASEPRAPPSPSRFTRRAPPPELEFRPRSPATQPSLSPAPVDGQELLWSAPPVAQLLRTARSPTQAAPVVGAATSSTAVASHSIVGRGPLSPAAAALNEEPRPASQTQPVAQPQPVPQPVVEAAALALPPATLAAWRPLYGDSPSITQPAVGAAALALPPATLAAQPVAQPVFEPGLSALSPASHTVQPPSVVQPVAQPVIGSRVQVLSPAAPDVDAGMSMQTPSAPIAQQPSVANLAPTWPTTPVINTQPRPPVALPRPTAQPVVKVEPPWTVGQPVVKAPAPWPVAQDVDNAGTPWPVGQSPPLAQPVVKAEPSWTVAKVVVDRQAPWPGAPPPPPAQEFVKQPPSRPSVKLPQVGSSAFAPEPSPRTTTTLRYQHSGSGAGLEKRGSNAGTRASAYLPPGTVAVGHDSFPVPPWPLPPAVKIEAYHRMPGEATSSVPAAQPRATASGRASRVGPSVGARGVPPPASAPMQVDTSVGGRTQATSSAPMDYAVMRGPAPAGAAARPREDMDGRPPNAAAPVPRGHCVCRCTCGARKSTGSAP